MFPCGIPDRVTSRGPPHCPKGSLVCIRVFVEMFSVFDTISSYVHRSHKHQARGSTGGGRPVTVVEVWARSMQGTCHVRTHSNTHLRHNTRITLHTTHTALAAGYVSYGTSMEGQFRAAEVSVKELSVENGLHCKKKLRRLMLRN